MGSIQTHPHFSLKHTSIYLLLIAGGFFLLFYFSSTSFITSQSLECASLSHLNKTVSQASKDELEDILKKASMQNKTVIISIVNGAYVEGDADETVPNMLDLFLEGFWAGEQGIRELLNHLIIVAVDQTAYERCLFRGLHCYRLVTDGVDFMGEKVFMSNEFNKMMWRRTLFLLDVLKRGYNFIFTDTDVIWLRNPFKVLFTNHTQNFDIQFSTDIYAGNNSYLVNPINTGFYFVKSNNKTIALFEKWYGLKDNSTGLKEQDVLQNLIWEGVLIKLGLNVWFLDTRYFCNFGQPNCDAWFIVTMHANCCRFIRAKVSDLNRVLKDWARFKVALANATEPFVWSPHVECKNSWHTNVTSSKTLD